MSLKYCLTKFSNTSLILSVNTHEHNIILWHLCCVGQKPLTHSHRTRWIFKEVWPRLHSPDSEDLHFQSKWVVWFSVIIPISSVSHNVSKSVTLFCVPIFLPSLILFFLLPPLPTLYLTNLSPTVEPLVFECSSQLHDESVVIDCSSNKPVDLTCYLDNVVQSSCEFTI